MDALQLEETIDHRATTFKVYLQPYYLLVPTNTMCNQ